MMCDTNFALHYCLIGTFLVLIIYHFVVFAWYRMVICVGFTFTVTLFKHTVPVVVLSYYRL